MMKQNKPRNFSPIDNLMMQFDTGLRTLFGKPSITERSNPEETVEEGELSAAEKELAGRLMRINHSGEVAAQGLYQGQALTAKLPEVRQKMERAAQEENDHLDWCEKRIHELGTHTSYLNPLWYIGSVAIGATEGLLGASLKVRSVPVEHLAIAVAAFRLVTFWMWIPVGWIAIALLRKQSPEAASLHPEEIK